MARTFQFAAFASLAVALAMAGIHEAANAQMDHNQRRAALMDAKTAAEAGDYADAVEALQPLADAGDPIALYSLGILYSAGGKDLPKDYGKAMSWFLKAAEKRDAGSMRQVAIAHEKGLGVPANPASAVDWYGRAADRGDALAQLNLGIMRAKGEGAPQDPVGAYKWFTLASNGIFYDNEEAKRAETKTSRIQLASKMSPPQIQQAEKQAREWSAK